MARKWWGRERSHKYIDDNKARVKNQTRKELPFLLEFGNEEDIREKAKIWNPKITEEEIEEVIKLYRAAKSERAHDQ